MLVNSNADAASQEAPGSQIILMRSQPEEVQVTRSNAIQVLQNLHDNVAVMAQMQSMHLVRQDSINKTNAQLHTVNFLFNYANASKYEQLNEQYALIKHDIKAGHQMLAEMQDTIQHTRAAVGRWRVHVCSRYAIRRSIVSALA